MLDTIVRVGFFGTMSEEHVKGNLTFGTDNLVDLEPQVRAKLADV